MGFNAAASHKVIDLAECHVLLPELFALIAPLRRYFAALKGRYAIEIELARVDQGVDCGLKGFMPEGLAQTENLLDFCRDHGLARLTLDHGYGAEGFWEPEPVTVTLGGIAVAYPTGAFLQATHHGEAALVGAAREWLADCTQVADLFSGLGTFALALAQGRKVLAAEADRTTHLACRSAANSARLPVEAVHRDLFRNPMRAEELAGFDGVLLDPPRAGAREQIEQIAASGVGRVVYISCNPSSWSRDAATLAAAGYELAELRPVGQFRWSTHVELASLFVRRLEPYALKLPSLEGGAGGGCTKASWDARPSGLAPPSQPFPKGKGFLGACRQSPSQHLQQLFLQPHAGMGFHIRMARPSAAAHLAVSPIPARDKFLPGPVIVSNQDDIGLGRGIEAFRDLRVERSGGSGLGKRSLQATEQGRDIDAATQQPEHLRRIAQPAGIARADGIGRGQVLLAGVVIVGPRIGQDERIAHVAAHQHQRARSIAIAEGDDPLQLRAFIAERGQRGENIRAATAKPGVLAAAVPHAAPVEAEHREALRGQARGQLRLPGKSPAAQFVAAADDQQATASRGA